MERDADVAIGRDGTQTTIPNIYQQNALTLSIREVSREEIASELEKDEAFPRLVPESFDRNTFLV